MHGTRQHNPDFRLGIRVKRLWRRMKTHAWEKAACPV